MQGRSLKAGVALLCALSLCAFAAASASAGTTQFTCAATSVERQFTDEHCTIAGVGNVAGFKHVAVGTEATTIAGSNEKTKNETKEAESATLIGTVGGLAGEFVCKKVVSSGSAKNEEVGGAMTVGVTAVNITFSECTAPKPAGQECKIKSGEVKVAGATAMSEKEKLEFKFEPEKEKPFATFTLEGCKTAGLNKAYEVTGTANALAEGATLTTTAATTEGTLKLAGQKASFLSKTTIRRSGGNPLTLTKTTP